MTPPVCLGGTYTLAGDVFRLAPFVVVAMTASTVILHDHAGRPSQIHLATFRANWKPVR